MFLVLLVIGFVLNTVTSSLLNIDRIPYSVSTWTASGLEVDCGIVLVMVPQYLASVDERHPTVASPGEG